MTPTHACMSDAELQQLAHDELPLEAVTRIEEHLCECRRCRELLDVAGMETSWCDEIRQLLTAAPESSLPPTTEQKTDQEAILRLLGPSDDPRMLGRIGGYEVTGIVGRGGMGIVFKAFDAALGRFVAIKMLLPHLAASGAARQRFSREGQAAAAVIDDHVLPIHSVDQWQGVPYLVTQYSRGTTLQKRIQDQGQLELKEILRISLQTARGLAAAHSQGLVHRDVKPSNILLDGTVERALLTDFGLARAADDASVTRTGTVTGTPQYMSPEQVRGESVDGRSDLFSLGCTMYAMCTGRSPFRSDSTYAVMHRITSTQPTPIREINPDVPKWLCEIIARLMAKQPEERFASAADVAQLLEECLAHVQQPTVTPLPDSLAQTAPQQNHRPPIGKRIAVAAFAFSMILAGVLFVLETNKGTLVIESVADDIPIRIKQGDETVRRLTVSREGTTTRLHAGQYTVEIDVPHARYAMIDDDVIVTRGKTEIAKVTYRGVDAQKFAPLTNERLLYSAVLEFNNLHPNDAKGRPQPRLTLGEVVSALLWKRDNGELPDDVVTALWLRPNTGDFVLPAGWQLTGGLMRRRCDAGIVQTWEINLDTDGLSKPIPIRRSAIAPPEALRKPNARPADTDHMISLADAIDQFNAAHSEIERTGALPHPLPPLTVDEVLAAVALWQTERDTADVDDVTREVVQRVTATHQLPPNIRLELVPALDDSIGQRFIVESIGMRIPRADNPETTVSLPVRHRFIERDRNHPTATHWGRPGSNGIQAGVRLVPSQQTYRHGQVVDIEFLYRSVTSKEVPATLPSVFQFGKVSGIRFVRESFVRPKWPDGSLKTTIGNQPVVVRGHRMQVCFDETEPLMHGVNLRAITRPKANHYVRFKLPNPGDDAPDELLAIDNRLFFRIPPTTPPKVLPVYDGHYYLHWGYYAGGKHRRPAESTPDPNYIDPLMLGMSLGTADKSRIPAYYAGGLQVTKVAPHSPAEAAGIEVGDILLSWEGHQIYGDDPSGDFLKYSTPSRKLKELQKSLQKNGKFIRMGSGGMKLDLLDHRTGEVIRITPWYGGTAGGSYTKAQLVELALQRKGNRGQPTRRTD